MLILILIIFISLNIALIKWSCKNYNYVSEFMSSLIIISFAITLLLIMATVSTSLSVYDLVGTDKKIKIYTEENTKIEQQVNYIVENYKYYEGNTYKKIKTTSPTTLIALYPELKTDKLVSKQIDVYIENNKKIKKLKEDEVNLSKAKFFLYFGR